jgi:hypothetical protein
MRLQIKKSVLANITICISTIILTWLLIEIALRAFFPELKEPERYTEFNQYLGYDNIPNLRAKLYFIDDHDTK